MGQLVEQLAKQQGHEIVSVFNRQTVMPRDRLQELSHADIAIDFSTASCVLDHLSMCTDLQKPIVIGTTGWDDRISRAKAIVDQSNGSCLFAPNFSIGAYLYRTILKQAASIFQPFYEYDVCGIESHHSGKLDAPSGTAQTIRDDLLHHMPRVESFNFASIRSGYAPGTHTVQFDSPSDTLTFTHQARNRDGFARGALTAAQWLIGKTGFFSLDEMMNDLTCKGVRCH